MQVSEQRTSDYTNVSKSGRPKCYFPPGNVKRDNLSPGREKIRHKGPPIDQNNII